MSTRRRVKGYHHITRFCLPCSGHSSVGSRALCGALDTRQGMTAVQRTNEPHIHTHLTTGITEKDALTTSERKTTKRGRERREGRALSLVYDTMIYILLLFSFVRRIQRYTVTGVPVYNNVFSQDRDSPFIYSSYIHIYVRILHRSCHPVTVSSGVYTTLRSMQQFCGIRCVCCLRHYLCCGGSRNDGGGVPLLSYSSEKKRKRKKVYINVQHPL